MTAHPWPKTALTEAGFTHPIVLAGLAGGPGSPELVAAVSAAGGLGTLGGAYMSPSALDGAMAAIRGLTDRPYAVNLFLPERPAVPESAIAEMNARLDGYRRELGIPLSPEVTAFAEDFEAQLAVVLSARPAIVSFTFGCPDPALVTQLHGAGIQVWGTATRVGEAVAIEAAGADAVTVQGVEAGGHRGTFPGATDPRIGTMALVPQVVDRVRLPVIAAGGLMDGRGIAAALALGAAGAQLGTAFLAATEAGTHPAHQAAVLAADDTATTLTRAFSGRWARGVRNRFVTEWEDQDVLPFPIQNALTRDIRQAAARQNRPELLSLWAGQAAGMTRRASARELIEAWAAEADAAFHFLRTP